MAARKKAAETMSLFGAMPEPTPREVVPEPEERATRPLVAVLAPPVGDAQANDVEPKAPPLREVERKPDGVSVVLHMRGEFLVERVREAGGSYAGVFYSRAELVDLIARATEALR